MTENPDLQTVTRNAKKRVIVREFFGGRAAEVLEHAGFAQGLEVTGFTLGQFSFIDLIEAALKYSGPADVLISTWSASSHDIGRVRSFCEQGRIRACQFLIDAAFESFNKEAAVQLREFFGDENIRVVPNHAKFALVGNSDWSIVIQTSMNLNRNKRLENFTITDEKDFYSQYSDLVRRIWKLQEPGAGFGRFSSREADKLLAELVIDGTLPVQAAAAAAGNTMGSLPFDRIELPPRP